MNKPITSFHLPSAGGAVPLLLAVGTLLATSVVLAKAGAQAGWPPLALLQWALLGAPLLQLLLHGTWRNLKTLDRSAIGYMILSGILFAVPNALAFGAAGEVGAGFVAFCFAFPLMITYLLALALRMEPFQALKFTGVALGLIGAVLLAASKATAPGGLTPWAIAALSAPVIIAVANIYRTRYWPKGVTPVLLSTGMMVGGFLTMLVINRGAGLPLAPDTWNSTSAGLLAAQIVLFAALYDLYFRLQKLAGPVYLSQIGSVAAVSGAALAFGAFGEVPSPAHFAAFAAVGAGIYLVSRKTGSD